MEEELHVTMRVRPTPLLGAVFGLGYIPLWIGVAALLGGSMADMSSAARILPFVGALAVCALVLAVATTALGWWGPVLHDRARLGGVGRLALVVWVVVILAGGVLGQGWTVAADRLLALVALAVLVGFSEELAYRGLTLTGFRGGMTERRAWLLATILFALLHLPNIILGQAVGPTIGQVALSFMGGTSLYLIRRATGSIVPAMVLHGAWDFVAFTIQVPALGLLQLAANLLIFVVFLVRFGTVFGPDSDGQIAR